MGPSSGWWTSFFEGQALETWRRAFSRDESRGQALDIQRALGLTGGESVLDVPCGNARLGLELAATGARVSGLDGCEEFVLEGRAHAAERGLELDLRTGDMRELPWESEFDAALCAGNSFAYFDDRGNRDFLRAVARSLRPGGCFLLEYPLVAEIVLEKKSYRDWHVLGESILLVDGHYDPIEGRLESEYTFVDLTRGDGSIENRRASYQVYTARETAALLQEAGFDSVRLLGDLDGTPFGPSAREFYALATRERV